jgi:rRNA-processing protein FCF1
MTTARDPLAGVDLLLVDGSNLLHAMRGESATVGAPAAVIGRLRGVIPASTAIQLVFDGPPDRGLGTARIASGVGVRYSGRRSADDVILQLARDRADIGNPEGSLLVVTDDRELGGRLRRWGARVIGTAWLIGRLGRARLSSPSAGRSKAPPEGSEASEDVEAGDDARSPSKPAWQPGRGATVKRGNPRRAGRSRSGTHPWRRG